MLKMRNENGVINIAEEVEIPVISVECEAIDNRNGEKVKVMLRFYVGRESDPDNAEVKNRTFHILAFGGYKMTNFITYSIESKTVNTENFEILD